MDVEEPEPTAVFKMKDVRERQALATFDYTIGASYILCITDYTIIEAAAAVSTTPDLSFYTRTDWRNVAPSFKCCARANRLFPVVLRGFYIKERKSAHACLMKLEATIAWENTIRSEYDPYAADAIITASIQDGKSKAALRVQRKPAETTARLPEKVSAERIAAIPHTTLETALNRAMQGSIHIVDRNHEEAWIVPTTTIRAVLKSAPIQQVDVDPDTQYNTAPPEDTVGDL